MKVISKMITTYETKKYATNVKHVHVNSKHEGLEVDFKIGNVLR